MDTGMRISRTGEDKDMVKLYDKGVYLLNGTEIVEDVNEVRTDRERGISGRSGEGDDGISDIGGSQYVREYGAAADQVRQADLP